MVPGARTPYRYGPSGPRWLRLILVTLGIAILAVFIVDRLWLTPPESTMSPAGVIDHLNRHDVRRVTIPARAVTIELNDGKTLTTTVTADRDLWPAIRRSGADVSIVPTTAARGEGSPLNYAFQFVPFVIMALLLIFILQRVRAAQSR